MSFLFWLGIAAYAFTALLSVRLVAGHLAWSWLRSAQRHTNADGYGHRRPLAEYWGFAYVFALVTAPAWPIVVAAQLVGARLPKIGAERLAEIEARERRLREAEHELGLVDR